MADNVNINVKVNTQNAQKNTETFRAKVRELTAAMTQLQLEGKANTAEYQKLAAELGRIKDAMGDTAAQARILSDDFFQQRAAMEGLSVGINVFSGLTQAAALCGVENENLQKVLVKLQAAQNLANVAMNIAKALNKDTALMTALRMKATQGANTELKKETANLEVGTAAMGTYTAGEAAATTGAITLKGAIKAVGTAIKSVPVIGWVLAAVAAITTLLTLISDANDAEEEGNRLRDAEQAQLDAIHAKHQKITEEIRQQNYRLAIQLGQVKALGSGAVEYKDAMQQLATTTNLSIEYLESLTTEQQQAILNTYTQMSDAQEYLAELQEIQAEQDKKWEEAKKKQYSEDEDERKKAIADLDWMSNEQSSYYKKNAELAVQIASAQNRIAEQQKSVNKERQAELDWKEKTTKETQAQKNAEQAVNKAIQERNALIKQSIQEQESLLKFITDQEKQFNDSTTEGKLKNIDLEEQAIIDEYDEALDAAIKYYGEESEEAKKLLELRLQALEQLGKKRQDVNAEASAAELEQLRKEEDSMLRAQEATLEQKLLNTEEYTDEYLELIESQYNLEYKIAMTELERKFNDQLILEEEFNAQSLLLYEDLEKKKADLHKQEQDRINAEDLANTESMISQFSEMTSTMLEADLEKVKGNEEEEAKVRKKYARMTFLSQVASIGIDTAKAIMSIWSTAGQAGLAAPAYGTAMTGLIMATGAAQVAKARAAMDNALSGKAAKGAFITGKSHSEGGELWELEGGEAVLNKKAMAVPAFRQLASDMNVATGGVSFTNSTSPSILTATLDPNTIATIVNRIAAIPVTVTEENITTAQRNVSVLENRSVF